MGTLEIVGSLCWRGNTLKASVEVFSPGSRSGSSLRHSSSDLTSDEVYMARIGKTYFQPYTSLLLFQECKAQVVIFCRHGRAARHLSRSAPPLHAETPPSTCASIPQRLQIRASEGLSPLPLSGLESEHVSRGYTFIKTLSFIYVSSKSGFLCVFCQQMVLEKAGPLPIYRVDRCGPYLSVTS